MENIGQARPWAVGFHPYPLLRFPDNLPGIAVAHMIGNHHAVAVYFHPVKNPVAVLRIFAVGDADKSVSPTHAVGGADPIRLYHVNPQRVGAGGRGLVPLENREHITRHQPRHKRQLLERVKIVHAYGVTALFVVRPPVKFCLRLALPVLRGLRGKA